MAEDEAVVADHPDEDTLTINPPKPVDKGGDVVEYGNDPDFTPTEEEKDLTPVEADDDYSPSDAEEDAG